LFTKIKKEKFKIQIDQYDEIIFNESKKQYNYLENTYFIRIELGHGLNRIILDLYEGAKFPIIRLNK